MEWIQNQKMMRRSAIKRRRSERTSNLFSAPNRTEPNREKFFSSHVLTRGHHLGARCDFERQLCANAWNAVNPGLYFRIVGLACTIVFMLISAQMGIAQAALRQLIPMLIRS
jgi:hypothetical protein